MNFSYRSLIAVQIASWVDAEPHCMRFPLR